MPEPALQVTTIDMHTAGEPVRIVAGGYPPLIGDTILDKRRYARDHLDQFRRLLMFEPRGHRDMYGVIPVEPDHADADLAVLFMHNEGYSTMCGHAVIALGRWAVDEGMVERVEPETAVAIQVPAGLVRTTVEVADGRAGAVRFESVPAFALALDEKVEVPGYGPVEVDVGYGGAFYAIVPAARLGLDVSTAPTTELVAAAWAVTTAVSESVDVRHPDEEDLGFLYGTILTDGADEWNEGPTANICVFANRQVDRSPTGSGVTARIACQVVRGQIRPGQVRRFRGPSGAEFTGTPRRSIPLGSHQATTVEVGGRAHYVGRMHFELEPDDPQPGFLLR